MSFEEPEMTEPRNLTLESARMRQMFTAIADEYANAVLTGREHAWGEMAHSYIALVLSREPLRAALEPDNAD
jgi:hypothetical protein